MFTSDAERYNTFNNRADLTLIDKLDQENLEKAGGFEGDIFVAAMRNDQENIRLGELARKEGVKRVIIRLNHTDAEVIHKLVNEDIEVFNFTNVRSSLMRALIESPAVYHVMTDTKNVLYSVVVRNTTYTGRPLRDWNFVDQMTVSRIRRDGKWISPNGATVIEPGDEVIFSGEFEIADRIRKILGKE